MKHKFTQPVSMVVTKEQYERDLKQGLVDLGYKEEDILNNVKEKVLITNYMSYHDRLSFLVGSGSTINNRHFIDTYNPELFLALAGMTNTEKGVKGEWFIARKGSRNFTKNGLYMKAIDEGRMSFIDNEGDANSVYGLTKATKDELITHFTLPTKWYIKITEGNLELCKEWQLLQGDFKGMYKIDKYSLSYYCLSKHIFDTSYVYHDRLFTKSYNHYREISTGQLKQIIKNKKQTMEQSTRFPFTLQEKDAKRIIKIACGGWQDRLINEWSLGLLTKDCVKITEVFYKKMRKACTNEQNELFDDIFGKDSFNRNIFKKGLENDLVFSDICNDNELQLLTNGEIARSINRLDLTCRALYVSNEHEVIVHKSNNVGYGTVIEIVKK